MIYRLLTDDELHRVARDSTDPLTLELLRRVDARGDELREANATAESDSERITELEADNQALATKNNSLRQKLERARAALAD